METLAYESGKTHSKIFEEAIALYKENKDKLNERLKILEDMNDDTFLDLTDFIKNRKANN